MAGKYGERKTGGSRPDYRHPVEEAEWRELLAERAAPADGRGTPKNIIRRPLQLPPMVPIKDAGDDG